MITRKTILIVAILTLTIAAAVGALSVHNHFLLREQCKVLKEAVSHDFNDPESARFRSLELQSLEGPVLKRLWSIDFSKIGEVPISRLLLFLTTYDQELLTLCGEVNAKNAFGAYVGYKRFYLSGAANRAVFIDVEDGDDFATRMCEFASVVVYSEP